MLPAYGDAWAAGLMPEAAAHTFLRWLNLGDPGAGLPAAAECRAAVAEFRAQLDAEMDLGGEFSLLLGAGPGRRLADAVVRGWRRCRPRALPHFVLDEVLACPVAPDGGALHGYLQELASDSICCLTVAPFAGLAAALRGTTCLVATAVVDPRSGGLRGDAELRALGGLLRARRAGLHLELAPAFGRRPLHPRLFGATSFAAGFAAAGGPPGLGLLGVQDLFRAGFRLPLPGLELPACVATAMAAFAGWRLTARDREAKDRRLARLAGFLQAALAKLLLRAGAPPPAWEPPGLAGGLCFGADADPDALARGCAARGVAVRVWGGAPGARVLVALDDAAEPGGVAELARRLAGALLDGHAARAAA